MKRRGLGADQEGDMADDPAKRAELIGAQVRTAASVFQIVATIVGFATLTYALGQKSEQLAQAEKSIAQLAQTINDLARAQTAAAISDARQAQTLEDIQRRLVALEGRIHGDMK